MFAGHFGFAAAVKAKSPEVPLWALMLSTQLLDVVFVPLYLAGLETAAPVAGGGYGGSVIHADYSHSLIGTLILALLAGLLAGKFWGRRSGIVIASVVFSHWLLDFVVHRADLPFLPGNTGHLSLFGLGLWELPAASIVLEAALVVIGSVLYFHSTVSRAGRRRKRMAALTGGVLSILLILSLLTDVLNI
ncbi:hypothetical protein [Aneurinibacillus tyrosinisolvens]|uniref:hypothetical protein n=1 Tax=Aneurinibacillus tyrosinisolvens TaxID=1443435 RepID=UPI00063F2706|nr:hypothetical protein [Aneurinibacillus tyrosinisolvens]